MNEEIKNKLLLLLKKLSSDKKSLIIILVGIIGMLMIFLSEISTDNNDSQVTTEKIRDINYYDGERKLEELIGTVDGVGRVRVMITYECSSENIYASDSVHNQNEDSYKTDNEYIIIDSGENEKGLLIKEVYPKILGVAVVCEGGDDATVKKEITTMIKALYDISSNSISITKMVN